jgi:hypothetical protein
MELVTHHLTIGALTRQIHLFDEDRDEPIDGGIGRDFDSLFLIAGRIPDFNFDVTHKKTKRLDLGYKLLELNRSMQESAKLNGACQVARGAAMHDG